MAVGKAGAVSIMNNLFVASCIGVLVSILTLYSYKKLLMIKPKIHQK